MQRHCRWHVGHPRAPLCRCPLESLGLLLYRKLDAAPPEAVVVPVPALGVPAPDVQQWIDAYAAQLLVCAGPCPAKVGCCSTPLALLVAMC
jgi:hypothetical protein